MSNPSVSIIVPAYNEAGNITGAVHSVLRAATAVNVDVEVIVVDDGSTDATYLTVVHNVTDARACITRHTENAGLRAAYETGLSLATMPYVGFVPGDGEMAYESIVEILKAVGTTDLLIPYHGTPERRPWFRRLLTWVSTQQLNVFLGHDLRYYQSPVVYPTDLARRLPRTEDGFFFVTEMLAYALEADPSYVEIPLVHQERRYGASKAVSLKAIWRAQMLILRLFWRLRVRTAFQALGFALEHR